MITIYHLAIATLLESAKHYPAKLCLNFFSRYTPIVNLNLLHHSREKPNASTHSIPYLREHTLELRSCTSGQRQTDHPRETVITGHCETGSLAVAANHDWRVLFLEGPVSGECNSGQRRPGDNPALYLL
jgi:hypothetical protein